jgi:hypothetical protein
MVELTGGAHLARALQAEGITRVFGIPGTHNLEIFAQLSAHGIDIVSPTPRTGRRVYGRRRRAYHRRDAGHRHDHGSGRAQRPDRAAPVIHRLGTGPPHLSRECR